MSISAFALRFAIALVGIAGLLRLWLLGSQPGPESVWSLLTLFTLASGFVQDLVAAAFLSAPLVLAALPLRVRVVPDGDESRAEIAGAPKHLSRWTRVLKFYAGVSLGLWWLLHLADALFFQYSARRLGFELFLFSASDLDAILRTAWSLAPGLLLSSAILFAAGGLYFWRLRLRADREARGLHRLAAGLTIALAFSPLSAYVRVERITPHGFYQELEQNLGVNLVTERVLLAWLPRYVPERQALADLREFFGTSTGDPFFRTPTPEAAGSGEVRSSPDKWIPRKIVVILMEGVWAGDINARDTPGLWRLKTRQAIDFPNFYAAGLRTRNGLFSLLTGWPDLVNYSAVRTYAMYHSYASLPRLLRSRGFKGSFVYGGDPGFEGYDRFVRQLGIETIIGREQLRSRPENRNASATAFGAGYHDDVVLREIERQLAAAPDERQFLLAMLLTTHAPFALPPGAPERSSGGDAGYGTTLRFTDRAIADFLRRAGSQPYARETLFIVTADHTHQMQPPDAPPLEIFRVPFYWYIPGQRPGVVEYPAGQMDLLPTLQALVGDSQPLSTAGQALFAKTAGGAFAYASAGRRVLWVDRCGGYRVNLQGGQLLPVFAPMSAAWIERCRQPANSRSFARKKALLLAYFQTTRNRLLRNEFSIPAQ